MKKTISAELPRIMTPLDKLADAHYSENKERVHEYPYTCSIEAFKAGYACHAAKAQGLLKELDSMIYNWESNDDCDQCCNNSSLFSDVKEALKAYREKE